MRPGSAHVAAPCCLPAADSAGPHGARAVPRPGSCVTVERSAARQYSGEWCNGSPPAFGAVRSRFESGLPSRTRRNSVRRGCEHTFPMPRTPPFSEADARAAIEHAICWADALRLLGYKPRGHNYRTLQRWARHWSIPTDHFDADAGRRRAGRTQEIPLERVLVENSTYSRDKLKRRLFSSGLKFRRCELCGLGEEWRGRPMSLILDHINGR